MENKLKDITEYLQNLQDRADSFRKQDSECFGPNTSRSYWDGYTDALCDMKCFVTNIARVGENELP